MKVRISTLVQIADAAIGGGLDEAKFVNAVRSSIGQNVDKETLGSTGKEGKEGVYFKLSLTARTGKMAGVDARSIHWLANVGELLSFGLLDGGGALSTLLPKPATDVATWLGKFKVQDAPETKK